MIEPLGTIINHFVVPSDPKNVKMFYIEPFVLRVCLSIMTGTYETKIATNQYLYYMSLKALERNLQTKMICLSKR